MFDVGYIVQLRSMAAMWRLLRGHGKPRMFARLAAQRAALAALPHGPQQSSADGDVQQGLASAARQPGAAAGAVANGC